MIQSRHVPTVFEKHDHSPVCAEAKVFRLEKHRFFHYTAEPSNMRHSGAMKRNPTRPAAPNPARAARQGESDGLQSLQAAFRILDELSNAHHPLGLTDLAAM